MPQRWLAVNPNKLTESPIDLPALNIIFCIFFWGGDLINRARREGAPGSTEPPYTIAQICVLKRSLHSSNQNEETAIIISRDERSSTSKLWNTLGINWQRFSSILPHFPQYSIWFQQCLYLDVPSIPGSLARHFGIYHRNPTTTDIWLSYFSEFREWGFIIIRIRTNILMLVATIATVCLFFRHLSHWQSPRGLTRWFLNLVAVITSSIPELGSTDWDSDERELAVTESH